MIMYKYQNWMKDGEKIVEIESCANLSLYI